MSLNFISKNNFLAVGKLGEAFFQQIMKVLWYRNILYTCKLTCFNLLIVKYYGLFTLSFELNMSLSHILFPMHDNMNRLIKSIMRKKWQHNIHVVFYLLFIYIFEAWKMEGKFKIQNSNFNWVWNIDWIWLNLKLSLKSFLKNIFFQNNLRWGKLMFRNHQLMCIYINHLEHFLGKNMTLLN